MNNSNNRVMLTGNLGRDPEVKEFENGKKASFSIATTDEYKTRNGTMASDTQWHNICAWGKLADKVVAEIKKGSFVSIEGRLVTRTYEKNGEKKYFTEIVAEEINVNSKAA